MTAEIVNLRRARKARRRADDARDAQANRAAHGISRAEREQVRLATLRVDRVLEGARREPEQDPEA